jgi:hypothetical protein
MSLRSGFFVLFLAAVILAGIGGCEWKDETGFVEIRKAGNLAGADVLLLNSTEIAGLAQKDRLIIQEPVGAATLQLKRGENNQKLCDFEIKKNRVITVTVSYVNASMRCTVQS